MKYIIGSLIALVALLTPSVSQVNFGGPGGSFGGVFDAALNYLSGTVSDGCAEWSSNQLTSTGSDCNSGGSFGQVFELTTNTFSQSAVAPTTTQNLLINGTGTSTFAGGLEAWRQIAAPYFHATSTATSTFAGPITMVHPNHLTVHAIRGDASDGLTLKASNYATVATFGAAGGQNITFPGYTSALLQTGSGGAVQEYSGTSCTNQFVRSLSALGIATCETVANTDLANSTISGVSLGSNLNALTNDATLSGSSYNGSSAISDWGIDLTHANSWTGLQTFANATTTLLSASYASSTLYYGAGLQTCNATTGKLAWANGQFTCETDQTGSGGSTAWEEFAAGFIAPTSTVGVAVGATTTYNGTSLFQVNATNTTQTLISASSTASFTGNYLDFNDSTGTSAFTVNASGGFNASSTAMFQADSTSNVFRLFENSGGEYYDLDIDANGDLEFWSDSGALNLILFDATGDLRVNNGDLQLADGSAASPSLTFTNSTALGLYRVGTNILGFSAGGTQFIQADAASTTITNGNLGVGTTSPGTLLSIGGNATGINFVDGTSATSTFAGRVQSLGAFFTSFVESVAGIFTTSLTLAGDTLTGFDDDSTLSIVSGALRVVDLVCTNCIGGTEIDESSLTIPAGSYAAASIDGDDINSNIAGRSLTLTAGSPDTLDVDAELYTHSASANLIATSTADGIATSTEVLLSRRFPVAATITRIDCLAYDAGTSTIRAKINNTTDILYGTGLNCGADLDTASTTLQNTSLSAGDRITVWVEDAEPTGSRPRLIDFSVTWTNND